MVLRDEQTREYRGIRCDADGCEVEAPPAEKIARGFGLNNMGWHCWGGKHLCPAHAPEKKS